MVGHIIRSKPVCGQGTWLKGGSPVWFTMDKENRPGGGHPSVLSFGGLETRHGLDHPSGSKYTQQKWLGVSTIIYSDCLMVPKLCFLAYGSFKIWGDTEGNRWERSWPLCYRRSRAALPFTKLRGACPNPVLHGCRGVCSRAAWGTTTWTQCGKVPH